MQEKDNFEELMSRYKELGEMQKAEHEKHLAQIEELHNEMLRILGLSEWDEDEISKRMADLNNESKIKINQLLLAAKELTDDTSSSVLQDYDRNNKAIDAFIDMVRKKTQDNNLSEEDKQALQKLMVQITEMQGEDLKNYPKIQEIRNKLKDDKDI